MVLKLRCENISVQWKRNEIKRQKGLEIVQTKVLLVREIWVSFQIFRLG